MPTILKLSLDAEEYKRDLEAVIFETRAAAEKISSGKAELRVHGDSSPAKDAIEEVNRKTLEDKTVHIKADAPQATDVLDSLKENGVGEKISKGASAVNAIGTAAGVAVPQIGAFGAILNAVLSPISLITAGLGLLVTIGKRCLDMLTVSAEEYAESAKQTSEAADRALAQIRRQSTAAAEYVSRLKELSAAETAGNSVKAETAEMLGRLEKQYGDLGAEIDATTGKVQNLAEVEAKLNSRRAAKAAGQHQIKSNAAMEEAKAEFMQLESGMFKGSEGKAGRQFDFLSKNTSLEELIRMFDQRAKAATTMEDKTGNKKIADKLRLALEERSKSRSLNRTGYETEEEAAQALLQQRSATSSARAEREATLQTGREAGFDYEYSKLKDIKSKRANRQILIDEEQTRYDALSAQAGQQVSAVAKAEAGSKEEAAAQQALYELQTKMAESQQKIAGYQRQIKDLEDARAETIKQITDSAEYELKYNQLLIAGEHDKAAALKLEKEMRDRNIALSEEEKKLIIDRQKALQTLESQNRIRDAEEEVRLQKLLLQGKYEEYEVEKMASEARKTGRGLSQEEKEKRLAASEQQKQLKTQKVLADQADNLLGQAMRAAGRGTEWEREKALRDAEQAKGGKLTDAETEQVKKLFDLSKTLESKQASLNQNAFAGMQIKTNDLTARGGFQGGATVPEKSSAEQAIKLKVESMAETIDQIKTICQELGTF